MKNIYLFILLIITFSLCSTSLSAQRGCKVLMPTINKSYKGKCKRGFAHGKKGYAKGIDTYVGAFRKGLPHGSGTYTYATGEVYVGRWFEGMKHGEGRYTFKLDDRDTTTVGIWENDIYIGPNPGPPYKINRAQGVERHKIVRINEGNRAMIQFMQNGMDNGVREQFRIQSSSGLELVTLISTGFTDIEFPFQCRLSYLTWNKMKTRQIEVIFDFEINEPGDWSIVLHN